MLHSPTCVHVPEESQLLFSMAAEKPINRKGPWGSAAHRASYIQTFNPIAVRKESVSFENLVTRTGQQHLSSHVKEEKAVFAALLDVFNGVYHLSSARSISSILGQQERDTPDLHGCVGRSKPRYSSIFPALRKDQAATLKAVQAGEDAAFLTPQQAVLLWCRASSSSSPSLRALTIFRADGSVRPRIHVSCTHVAWSDVNVLSQQVQPDHQQTALDQVDGRIHELFEESTEEVLSSLPSRITQLVIIPHHSMANLPLGLLKDSTGRFLSERFQMLHCSSVSFLLHLHLRKVLSSQSSSAAGGTSAASTSSSSPARPSALVVHSEAHAPDIGVDELAHEGPERQHVLQCMKGAQFEAIEVGTASDFLQQVIVRHPRLVSIHCHGSADSSHPEENKLKILSHHGEWLAEQNQQLCQELCGSTSSVYKGIDVIGVMHRWLNDIGVKMLASMRIEQFSPSSIEVLLAVHASMAFHLFQDSGRFTQLQRSLFHLSSNPTVTKARVQGWVQSCWFQFIKRVIVRIRPQLPRVRGVASLTVQLKRKLLQESFAVLLAALVSDAHLMAEDIVRSVRLSGCLNVGLWSCQGGALYHRPQEFGNILVQCAREKHPELALLNDDAIRQILLLSSPDVFAALEQADSEPFHHQVHHLPHSFLLTGCTSVVSCLWNVVDAASIVFTHFFYQALLKQRLPVVEAVQRAQHHLRTLSRIDLLELEEDIRSSAASGSSLQTLSLQLPEDTDTPFEHPIYWAGYTVSGSLAAFDAQV